MKNSLKALVATLAVLAIATPAFAANPSGSQTVASLRVMDSGSAVVEASSTYNLNGCTQTDGFKLLSTDTQGAAMLKVVLAAMLAGKAIKVQFTGGCNGGYNVASSVQILQ